MSLTIMIVSVAILIIVSACSSKLAAWINMPSMVLFLVLGMLAGSEGIGKIPFDNGTAANYIGTVAMAFILFSGGFDTKWSSIKKVLTVGGLLSSLGVLLTAAFVGIFTYYFIRWVHPGSKIPLSGCLLLGSIISSTDAAAVFAIMRSRSVSLRPRLKSLLEFESGSNDPMAAFLTIFMVAVVAKECADGSITPLSAYWVIIPSFFMKMALGILLGFLIARGAIWVFNRIDMEYDGLYHVLATGTILLSFGGTELLQGNGFMAVYVSGVVMGNHKFIYSNGVGRFCDGLAWLMQVVLFSMLGLLAFPSHLWQIKWAGLSISVFLMFAARPLAVFLCMIGTRFSFKEKVLVSWVGLRGGAPIMLATFPLMAKIDYNYVLFHIVFFIVLTSIILQGMTIMPLAKLLGLDLPLVDRPRAPLLFENTGNTDSLTHEFEVLSHAPFANKKIMDIGLPKGALALLIRRSNKFLVPQGNTEVLPGDFLMIMGSPDALKAAAVIFEYTEEEE